MDLDWIFHGFSLSPLITLFITPLSLFITPYHLLIWDTEGAMEIHPRFMKCIENPCEVYLHRFWTEAELHIFQIHGNPFQIHEFHGKSSPDPPSEIHEIRRKSKRRLSAPHLHRFWTEAELHNIKEGTEGNAQELHMKKEGTERSASRGNMGAG